SKLQSISKKSRLLRNAISRKYPLGNTKQAAFPDLEFSAYHNVETPKCHKKPSFNGGLLKCV
ncbi:MAG: hypothetical protein VXV91_08260, partial [Verrucomicrobiota bacterium]|nr:hypothetical protein [Verrucomicrobiota bacterium]MEC7235732.1 hypothetical protein [Verrucomicrobiota bacterium]